MTIYVRTSGVWRTIVQPYARTSGTWRTINVQSVRSGGIWRQVFPDQGQLWTWGSNPVGDNTSLNRNTPVTTLTGGTNWNSVSSGSGHKAAIKTDGTLWIWGYNTVGELGINNTTTRSTPVTTFSGGTNWKQVACGRFHTAAIKTDGTLWTWGQNTSGELGINNTTTRSTPVTTFSGGTNWKQVACGGGNTAAIKTDGTLWVWGENSFGQLGVNGTGTLRNSPVTTILGGTNWYQVDLGLYHMAAIKTDGTLWTWGRNSEGQLGINNTTQRNSPVTTFSGGTNWKQVNCGWYYTTAIKTDGTLWAWGLNGYGSLGDNTTRNRSTPVTTFSGGTNWNSVSSAGNGHNAAIKTDGTLWTWGRNAYGQLGINISGFAFPRTTPVTTILGGNNWKQVACGDNTTLAIR